MSQTTLFNVPSRHEVSETNQTIFDRLEKALGLVPNIYAAFAYSDTALSDFLAYDNRKTTLQPKEKEVINLAVSQVNGCEYCLAAHTVISQKAGFTEEQVLEIRKGRATFDPKLDALAQFAHSVAENRGKVDDIQTATLLDAGYTEENIVDIVLAISGITTTNYLHNITEVPVDFPPAPAI